MIDENDRRSLLRLLGGEAGADERRRIEARLAAEPELRLAQRRLEAVWSRLDPPAEVPEPDLADEVMARVREAEPVAPPWVRLAAAAALAAGIALGVGIGRLETLAGLEGDEPTLAERYLEAVTALAAEVPE